MGPLYGRGVGGGSRLLFEDFVPARGGGRVPRGGGIGVEGAGGGHGCVSPLGFGAVGGVGADADPGVPEAAGVSVQAPDQGGGAVSGCVGRVRGQKAFEGVAGQAFRVAGAGAGVASGAEAQMPGAVPVRVEGPGVGEGARVEVGGGQVDQDAVTGRDGDAVDGGVGGGPACDELAGAVDAHGFGDEGGEQARVLAYSAPAFGIVVQGQQRGGDEVGEGLVAAADQDDAVRGDREEFFLGGGPVGQRSGERADHVFARLLKPVAGLLFQDVQGLGEGLVDVGVGGGGQGGQAAEEPFVRLGPAGELRLPAGHAEQVGDQGGREFRGVVLDEVEDALLGEGAQNAGDDGPQVVLPALDAGARELAGEGGADGVVLRRVQEEHLFVDHRAQVGGGMQAPCAQGVGGVFAYGGEAFVVAQDLDGFGVAGAHPHGPDLVEEQGPEFGDGVDIAGRVGDDLGGLEQVHSVPGPVVAGRSRTHGRGMPFGLRGRSRRGSYGGWALGLVRGGRALGSYGGWALGLVWAGLVRRGRVSGAELLVRRGPRRGSYGRVGVSRGGRRRRRWHRPLRRAARPPGRSLPPAAMWSTRRPSSSCRPRSPRACSCPSGRRRAARCVRR